MQSRMLEAWGIFQWFNSDNDTFSLSLAFRFGFVGGGTKSGQFVIEDFTGVIRLHSGSIDLDRDKYELNVTAVDDGSCCEGGASTIHTSTAVVVVFITDVNDVRLLRPRNHLKKFYQFICTKHLTWNIL